jgi:hypothetical protein
MGHQRRFNRKPRTSAPPPDSGRIAASHRSATRSLQLRVLSGSYERRPTWVSLSHPIEHYRRLLERVTEESDRQQIINLLAEEQRKQKDAGDPVW